MEKASEFRIVFVTTNSFDNATHIARILVSEKLVACCTVISNVFSYYGWQGTIHERHEFQLLIKTSSDKLNTLENRIIELHVDEVPEIIAVTIDSISSPYLDWMKQALHD